MNGVLRICYEFFLSVVGILVLLLPALLMCKLNREAQSVSRRLLTNRWREKAWRIPLAAILSPLTHPN